LEINMDVQPADLLSSLRLFFGPDAAYTSASQQELVKFAASSDSGHGHADLPCGSGKSMAWTLPIEASLISGRRASCKCTIVVSPYKFLSAFQTKAATQFLDKAVDVWIVTLNSSDFQGSSVPDELMVGDVIPGLLFLMIHALAAFLSRQRSRLARLCWNSFIDRFVIDEIHTLLIEDFLSAYRCLQQLPSFGVPITTPNPLKCIVQRGAHLKER
jgi:superfamily II DNA helicase RecQ